MVPRARIPHDRCMNAESWSEMRRPNDNRMVGGVCAAFAGQLGIDPVIVRVVIAVLAVIGPAGWILYGAGWLLIPSEDQEHGPLTRAFGLEQHESQLMLIGFIIAAFLAGGWLIGAPFSWDTPVFWWAPWVILAALVWIVAIRPRSRRASDQTVPSAATATSGGPHPAAGQSGPIHDQAGTDQGDTDQFDTDQFDTAQFDTAQFNTDQAGPDTATAPASRTPHSPVLAAVTILAVIVALSVTWIWDQLLQPVPLSGYLLIALAVVTLGVLTGAWIGDAALLIGLGAALSIALAISLFPVTRTGDLHYTPESAAQVDTTYENGIGRLNIDLTAVSDPEELIGKTITIRQTIGQARVLVPDDIPTHAEGSVTVGNSELFGSRISGTRIKNTQDNGNGPGLTLNISQRIGSIEVIRR